MIEKMKFVSLYGDKTKIDEIIANELIDREIEFENPLTVFKNTRGFVPHTSPNPYEAAMRKFAEVFEYAGIEYDGITHKNADISTEELEKYIEIFDEQIHALSRSVKEAEEEVKKLEYIKNSLSPIADADIHVEDFEKLKFIKVRFGRMPLESYNNLTKYIDGLPTYFTLLKIERNYAWGVYFAARDMIKRVDHIFTTLYFERIILSDLGEGTPTQIIADLESRINSKKEEQKELSEKMDKIIAVQRKDLLEAYAEIKYFYDINTIKKYAVYTKNSFYMCFWADEALAKKLKAENETVIVEEPNSVGDLRPPTKIKNLRIFSPFEEFVKMYGVPRYNEIDPTMFLGIAYTLLFGIMFGDVGHGAALVLIGILMTLMKKGGFLGKLLIPIGISSTIFGFVYGTMFGYEGEHGIIKPLWFTPMENSTTMNNTLIYAVVLGVAIILICMIFNIINGVKQKEWHKIVFSQNGLAGMIFYCLALYMGLSIFMGSRYPALAVGIGIAVSLVIIFLQEPLSDLAKRKKNWMPKEKGGFFVQSFFELFEILLSFVTNSVSFVRVGAFALNHAGMMSVVIMFINQTTGTTSALIAVLGNLLVIGLEGLIVGIQVLRLGFYEMFSRFYDGDGREFKPIGK